MHIHTQVHAPTDEHFRLPLLKPDSETLVREAFGGAVTLKNQRLQPNQNITKPRLIFDGICNLCISAVRILSSLDRSWRINYVPFQWLSMSARARLGLHEELLRGQMHLVRSNYSIVSGPEAVAEICELLTPFGFLCDPLLRTRQAHQLYSWVAKRRYRLFGCRTTCYIAPEGSDWRSIAT